MNDYDGYDYNYDGDYDYEYGYGYGYDRCDLQNNEVYDDEE